MTAPLQRSVALTIDAAHPAFAGHFPGAPVLPGVVLLGLAIDALAAALAEDPASAPPPGAVLHVEQVKWLAAVGPGQVLSLSLAGSSAGADFEISRGTTPVARGRLAWRT